MNIDETISRLVELPRAFNSRNVSMYCLLRESGYFQIHDEVTEDALRRVLLEHPEYVDEWMNLSEEKRTSDGWFFRRSAKGYDVGYFPVTRNEHQIVEYTEGASACAAFIKREVEEIRISSKQL